MDPKAFCGGGAVLFLVLPSLLCAGPSTVTLTSSGIPAVLGSAVTLTAAVSPASASGSVTFYDGTSLLGTRVLTSGQAALTTDLLPSGTRSLKAYYAGDNNNSAATSATLAQVVNAEAANGFLPGVTYGVGSIVLQSTLVLADLNGDGKPDLIVPDAINGTISILIGKGDGTFQPVVNYPQAASAIAVGDFNGDGKVDLVTGNAVLLGNGDGTFQPPLHLNAGPNVINFIAVADFNGDGKADLAFSSIVLGPSGNLVTVLLGNGDGTFQAPMVIGTGAGFLTVGDFNGDGHADLVVGNSLSLGNGDGSFQPAVNYGGPSNPTSIAAGDFNGDGKTDLAITSSNGVSVLLGKGDGTFLPEVNYSSPNAVPDWVAVGDVNGDGKADLVASDIVLLGNGDGSFQPGVDYFAPSYGSSIVVADFNGDGRTDLAAVIGSTTVTVLLGATLIPTNITLTSAKNPSIYGQGTQLMATVSSANGAPNSGTVTFSDAQTLQTISLTNGQAMFSTSLPAGTFTFYATYSGNSVYAGSTSAQLQQTVDNATTTTTLSSSMNPTNPGRTITLLATVSPSLSAGSVTFNNGTTLLGTAMLNNGQAVLMPLFPITGTYPITASYSGSTNYSGSTSAVLMQEVGPPPMPVTITLASSASASIYGQPVTLTATAATSAGIPAGSGSVTFYDGTTPLGIAMLVTGKASLTTSLPATGTRSLHAYYSGDLAFGQGTSAVLAQLVGAAPANGFQAPVAYSTGTQPGSVAVGDFNADGHSDLVVANSVGSSVSVYLGNGDGTFQRAVNYTVTGSPTSVAIGDLNGDGKPDLVSANQNGTLSVLLGNGDGTFQPAVNHSSSSYATSVVVADFNGDGKLDLATANQYGNNVSVLLGNGDGTFLPPVNYAAGGSPISMVVGDFNGDGIADLVTASNISPNTVSSNLSIFLGKGDGTFKTAVNFSSGSSSYSVAAGDVNGDGKADLIVTNDSSNSVSVLLGNGDGTFRPGVAYSTGGAPEMVVVGDFNGDGKPDLAAAVSGGVVSLLLGNGDGTFQAPLSFAAGTGPTALAPGEFNGDGKADLAVVDYGGNAVSVLLGRLAGPSQVTLTSSINPAGYGQSVTLTARVSPSSAGGSVAFYDGVNLLGSSALVNGNATLATSLLTSGAHALHASYSGDALDTNSASAVVGETVGVPTAPANAFQPVVSYSAGLQPESIAVADFNGDGKADFAVANYGGAAGGGSVSVYLGNGDGTFQTEVNYAAGSGPISVAAADFNGVGKVDLVVANNSGNNVSVLLGNGDGTFQPPQSFAAGSAPVSVAVGDFNGDGKPDVAVANYGAGNNSTVSVLLGNGDGTFRAAVSYAGVFGVRFITVGDLNGDGNADLAVGSITGVSVLFGNGDGTFHGPAIYGPGLIYSIAIGDFNGDGKVDLATANYNLNNLVVLRGNGDGTFQAPVFYPVGTNPRSVVAGDFNGDGITDLAVASFGLSNGAGGSLSILLGNGDGTFQPAINFLTGTGPTAIAAGDFNGDGQTDLVMSNTGNSVSVYLGALRPAATVALTSSANPTMIGQSVTLTATVAQSTSGTVTFYDSSIVLGTNAIVNGQASLTTSFANAGVHHLEARFTANSGFVASTSPNLDQTVSGTLVPLPIALTASSNTTTYGQSLTLTAIMPQSGQVGAVTFYDGLTVLGSGVLAGGQASLTTTMLTAGKHSLTARYSGDANHAAATSPTLSQNVTPVPSSGFLPATTFPTGNNPFSVAAGDFNGDGKTDLAVANSGDGTVSVLLGNGDGTFQAPVSYAAGAYPYFVAACDVNLDGKPDLVVANNGDDNVSVLLGNGDGTFQPAMNYAVGSGPSSIAVGDFNGDGTPDLAVVNQVSNNFSVLLGNGDGSFQSAVNYPVGNHPNSIGLTDVNGDGKADLVISNDFDGSLTVYFGTGTGTFGMQFGSYSLAFGGSGPTSVAVGDFNGDGNPDVAVSNYNGKVFVLLSQSKSLFGTPVSYAGGLHPWYLAAADVNGDGKLDLVVANEGDNTVSVLTGKGDGTFQAAVNYGAGTSPVSVVAGDFNGDGKVDLAVVNYGDGTVSVLAGK